MKAKTKVPKIGDKIYVDTSLYVYRGADDVIGGLATVTEVTNGWNLGKVMHLVYVQEHPSKGYNWEFLAPKQNELKKEFGRKMAHAEPDLSPEFNDQGADWEPLPKNKLLKKKRD